MSTLVSSAFSEHNFQALLPQLVESAMEAKRHAASHCPENPIGVAVLTEEGAIFTGCAMATLRRAICAESGAASSALAKGAKVFQAIVIASDNGHMAPCSNCQEILRNINPGMRVIQVDKVGKIMQNAIFASQFPVEHPGSYTG